MLESIVVRNKVKLFLLGVLFLPCLLLAQDAPKGAAGKTTVPAGEKKKIFIQFDNELVDGQRTNPGVDYLFNRKEANYKKMMKLRENFLTEVKKGKRDFSGSK